MYLNQHRGYNMETLRFVTSLAVILFAAFIGYLLSWLFYRTESEVLSKLMIVLTTCSLAYGLYLLLRLYI